MSRWSRWTGLAGLALGARHRPRPAAVSAGPAGALQPALTHHQILALVAPFMRHGYRVDMAASQRLERRVHFLPVPHADERFAGLQETLQLHSPRDGYYRLQRSLQRPGGPCARLLVEGSEPAELLNHVQAVPAGLHFAAGEGFERACSLQLQPPLTPGTAAQSPRLVPTDALVQTGTLTLALQVGSSRGASAQLELQASPGPLQPLPDDLLAVLGWDWSLLSPLWAPWTLTASASAASPVPQGWRGSLRLRGSGSARLADLSRKLDTVSCHLAATLAEPPRRFHERHRAARWGVMVRRSIPLTVSAFMGLHVALAGPLTAAAWATAPAGALMLPLLAPAVLGVYLLLGEAPRIEVPPWPRASRAAAWQLQA